MSMQFAEIDDAVVLTQKHLIKRGAFVGLQTDLQDHVAVRELWKGRNKKVFVGGDPWTFDAQIDHNHSTRAVALYETDGSAVVDTMIEGKVYCRHLNAHYVYDQREKAFQRGGHAIVDYIKTKYIGMMMSFFEYLEETLWSNPADDGKTPFGVAHYVTRADGDGDFVGPEAEGWAAGKCNILYADQPRWRNWAARYVAISKEDLIRKMRLAARKTKFRSPISHTEPTLGGMKNGVYCNSDVIGLMEEILEDQNMNLGNDMASKDGRAHFKGTPVTYVPYLDNDNTEDPVYLLDWKWLGLGVLAGWENQLTAPYMVPNRHLVRRVDLDASLNLACTNLRRQAVISKAPA